MTPKTDNHIDTALRSVMERRAERIPTLSDDFAQQVMSKMNARRESARRHRRFAAVCSIAAALLIAFLVLQPLSNSPRGEEDSLSSERTKDNIGLPTLPPTGGAGRGAEKQIEVLAEAQPTPQPVKKRRKAAKKQSAPIEEPVLAQAEPKIPAEATSQPQETPLQLSPWGREPQPFHEASVSTMSVGTDEVDPKILLYTAEIELEKSTHQRQKAHEKEIQQRNLELLLYLMTNEEESIADGTVKTQKS